jgi:hypothetical protein
MSENKFEEELESVYWEYDAKVKEGKFSERDCFKQIIRKHYGFWNSKKDKKIKELKDDPVKQEMLEELIRVMKFRLGNPQGCYLCDIKMNLKNCLAQHCGYTTTMEIIEKATGKPIEEVMK